MPKRIAWPTLPQPKILRLSLCEQGAVSPGKSPHYEGQRCPNGSPGRRYPKTENPSFISVRPVGPEGERNTTVELGPGKSPHYVGRRCPNGWRCRRTGRGAPRQIAVYLCVKGARRAPANRRIMRAKGAQTDRLADATPKPKILRLSLCDQ